MRLGRVKIHGYRKLVATEFTTPGKLLAIVGPNEAGKSSLLDALRSLENKKAIPHADRPRGHAVADDEAAVEAWFRLDPEDLDAVRDLHTPTRPTWYQVSKYYDGRLVHRIEPPMERDQSFRRTAEQALTRFSNTRAARELDREASPGEERSLGARFDELLQIVTGDAELSDEERELARDVANELAPDQESGFAARARKATAEWLTTITEDHPNDAALELFLRRRPLFAGFGENARSLASDYDLPSVAEDPPAALGNLARIATLDLEDLAQMVAIQDAGAYVSATEEANDRLAAVFSDAWRQSRVIVRIHLDETTIRIMVSNQSGGYSTIAERSDGLKSFVALTAFAARTRIGARPLILLIDEAERHLHYDAQADLVRMLERQGLALQVIYTTHSPGCLPSDLGTGIRPIVPDAGGGRSRVANSFWTRDRGFQPLLMALGAGAAALAPTRYAVLAEGASDMLLLPTLVREATERDRLDYQVAPGVAEASWAQLLALEIEAPRVAYLLDGDPGGDQHVRRLTSTGVPLARIVQLGGSQSGTTAEDLLREDVYLRAVNETLERAHGTTHGHIGTADLAPCNRSSGVDAWCDARGLTRLHKAMVASMLLEQEAPSLLTQQSRRLLRTVHTQLCSALGLPP
jgi:predicted ATP-dependent endonuclease of OLD family